VTEDVYAGQLGLGLWPFFGANCASRIRLLDMLGGALLADY
jgi:hypothetical protein